MMQTHPARQRRIRDALKPNPDQYAALDALSALDREIRSR